MVRIGLFLMIPVGYAMTHQFYEQQQDEYLALNVLDFVVMLLLLMSLPRIRPSNIMICILLMIFAVGYFFKFYWLAYMLGVGASVADLALFFMDYSKWVNSELAYQAFEILAVSFIAFGAASLLWISLPGRDRDAAVHASVYRVDTARIHSMLYVALVCAIVTSIPRVIFHLGDPGQVEVLPFHLQGILYFLNQLVSPCLIGLALVLAMCAGDRSVMRRVMLWFVVWSLMQFVLFTSKSVLLLPLLWYVLARSVCGFRDRSVDRLILAGGALFVVVFPFLNMYRMAKVTLGLEMSGQLFDEFSYVVQTVAPDLTSVSDFVLFGLSGIIIRTGGFGELMAMHMLADAFPHGLLSYLISGQSPGELLTSIMGYAGASTGVSSSMLGHAYFVTGSIPGTALWVSLVILLVQFVSGRMLIKASPLSLALWVMLVIQVTFWFVDELGLPKLYFLALTMLAVSIVYRVVVGRYAVLGEAANPDASRGGADLRAR